MAAKRRVIARFVFRFCMVTKVQGRPGDPLGRSFKGEAALLQHLQHELHAEVIFERQGSLLTLFHKDRSYT